MSTLAQFNGVISVPSTETYRCDRNINIENQRVAVFVQSAERLVCRYAWMHEGSGSLGTGLNAVVRILEEDVAYAHRTSGMYVQITNDGNSRIVIFIAVGWVHVVTIGIAVEEVRRIHILRRQLSCHGCHDC